MKTGGILKGLAPLISGWMLATASVGVWAQNAIESVAASMQGGVEVIRIDLSQALPALPTGFLIQTPARIALDFPGVTNSLGRSSVVCLWR